MDGIPTPTLPTATAVDALIGHLASGGVTSTVQISAAQLGAQIEASRGPNVELRSHLDLAWPDGTIAKVWGDPSTGNRGVHRKVGAAGTGSWTRIGPLPGAEAVAVGVGPDGIAGWIGRPGEDPDGWTADLVGLPETTTPLGEAAVMTTGDGRAVRITGPGVVAARGMVRLEPGRVYLVRYAVRRRVATLDPSGDGVVGGLQWLTQTGASNGVAAAVTWEDLGPGAGRQSASVTVATAAGTGIGVVAPSGTVYARPYVRQSGSAGVIVDVEVIDVADVTDADAYSPDLTALTGRVGALESADLPDRVSDLEAVTAGLTGASIGVDVMADLRGHAPAAGKVARTLGYASAGDGGDAYYKALTGASPGTYTDDAGATIVPTGGDGSACWRLVGDGAAQWHLGQFGGVADATVPPFGLVFMATASGSVLSVIGTGGLAVGMRVCTLHWHSAGEDAIAQPTTITSINAGANTVTLSRSIADGVHYLVAWHEISAATVAGTDNSPAMARMMAAALQLRRSDVYVRDGIYRFSDTVQVGYGQYFRGVTLRGDNRRSGYVPDLAGAWMVFTATDRPGVNIQGLFFGGCSGLGILGPNWSYGQALAAAVELSPDPLDWIAPTLHATGSTPGGLQTRSPLVGISVDAFSGTAPAVPYPRTLPTWTGLSTAYGAAISSLFDLTHNTIGGWPVGVATGLNHPLQGDFLNLDGALIAYTAYAIAVGNHQARCSAIRDVRWNGAHTVITDSAVGWANGHLSGVIDNCGGIKTWQIIDFRAPGWSGALRVSNTYAESTVRLGNCIGTSRTPTLTLSSCTISMSDAITGYLPSSILTTGTGQVIEQQGSTIEAGRRLAVLIGGEPSGQGAARLAITGGVLRAQRQGASSAAILAAVNYTGGIFVGQPLANSSQVRRVDWPTPSVGIYYASVGAGEGWRHIGAGMTWETSSGTLARAPDHQAVRRITDLAGRTHEAQRPSYELLDVDNPSSVVSGPVWSGDMMTFTLAGTRFASRATWAIAPGWLLYHHASSVLFLVETVTADGPNWTVVTRQQTGIKVNKSTGAYIAQISGANPDLSDGTLSVIPTGAQLPRQVYYGRHRAGASHVAYVSRGLDLAASDIGTYLASGDVLYGPLYGRHPIPPAGLTISAISPGSPARVLLSGAAQLGGTFPVYPLPLLGGAEIVDERPALANTAKRNRLTGAAWLASSSAADNNWNAVHWSADLGLFVAVATSGVGNRVMTSPDGITWTARTSAVDNQWRSVCWSPERRLLVAVADSGTDNRVMTSPDGITWTARTSAADNSWYSVCWSAELGLFVAVAGTGTGNRVMTSANGTSWTIRASAEDNFWRSVCWSAELGLFVAVASTGTANRVMTSPDGITWTARAVPVSNQWRSVSWSAELGLFAAVADTGTGNRVMTSPDGITWTARTSPADNNWGSVAWAAEIGLFCAVAYSGAGNRVMTSPDGITWTTRTSVADNSWIDACWSAELGLFCAVAFTGTGNRVMTSVSAHTVTYRS